METKLTPAEVVQNALQQPIEDVISNFITSAFKRMDADRLAKSGNKELDKYLNQNK